MAPQNKPPVQPPVDDAQKKADAFLGEIYKRDSVATEWGGNFGVLDDATLKVMVDKGSIIPLKKDDLSPALAAEIEGLNEGRPGGKADIPVYVVPRVGQNDASIGYFEMDGGKKGVILVSEAEHVWKPDYVRDHVLFSNAEIAADTSSVASTVYKPGTSKKQHDLAALVSHTQWEAVHEKISNLQVRINTDPDAQDAYATQSREGAHYLFISEKKLKLALSDDKEKQGLQQSIDKEFARIKNGETTPMGRITDKEADRFIANMPSVDGKTDLPPEDTQISNAALKRLVSSGRLIEVKESEFDPQLTAIMGEIKSEAGTGKNPLPTYVVPGNNSGFGLPTKAQLMKTTDGKPYLLINEGFHIWSKDYVNAHVSTSDTDIAASVNAKTLSAPGEVLAELHKELGNTQAYKDAQRRYLALLDTTIQEADGMKAGKVTVLVDNSTTGVRQYTGESDASSLTTKEKTNYIFFAKEDFKNALKSEQDFEHLRGTIGHEMSHIVNGDTKPEGIAASHDLEVSRRYEMLAELGAEGPLSQTRNPEARAKIYEEQLRGNIEGYVKKHPGSPMTADKATDTDLKAVSDWLVDTNFDPPHPARWDIIVALRNEATRMKEYESTHTVNTPEERREEQKWVNEKVLQVITPGKPKAENGGPQHTLNPDQKAAIEHIRERLGQAPVDTQIPTTPLRAKNMPEKSQIQQP